MLQINAVFTSADGKQQAVIPNHIYKLIRVLEPMHNYLKTAKDSGPYPGNPKIEAIKFARAHFAGFDLLAAKEMVEEIWSQPANPATF